MRDRSSARIRLAPRARRAHRACTLVASVVVGLAVSSADSARAAAGSPAWGRDGMVVTSEANATRAGHAMLEAGGNAVDAAVASAFALSVTRPFSTGLGGGAFILVRIAGAGPGGAAAYHAVDARETAPAGASRDMYVAPGVPERASLVGGLAAGTPGLVKGLEEVHARFGKLSWETVVAPAATLAREGFGIAPYHVRAIERMRARIQRGTAGSLPPGIAETARIQFPPAGEAVRPGWRLVQRDLAATLDEIARDRGASFYRGDVAAALAAAAQAHGGVLADADLAGYATRWREPVRGRYRDTEIISFPPPSSGGVALVEALGILEGFDLAARPAGSSASLHLIAEAMKLAFVDRAFWLGDPDFVDVPVAQLTSSPYIAGLRARLAPRPWWRSAPWHWGRGERALQVKAPGLPVNDSGTTHLSVTDPQGNAVSMTKTINTGYGSLVTAAGTGVILNNEMDDFAKAPNTPNAYGLVDTRGANAIAPGKRPLSSMTPTFVEREGELFMVTGSPGGPRIISTTLLSILNVLDYRMDVKAAVSAPRFHHQWVPDVLFVEPETPADVIDALEERGHTVKASGRHWSAAEAIVVDRERGLHWGGNDPRADGLALGFDARPRRPAGEDAAR